jgi:hypothetical protein
MEHLEHLEQRLEQANLLTPVNMFTCLNHQHHHLLRELSLKRGK